MVEQKYCPTYGREIREGTKTTHEIVENINKMLGINAWDIKGKRTHLLELEKAIKKCQDAQLNEEGKNVT